MKEDALLYEIQKLQFYAVELNFYLDNFPDNKRAADDYRKISKQLDKLIFEYESNVGPMKNFGASFVENPDKWVNQPWPWENVR